MESSDLNPHPRDDVRLEAWLRTGAGQPPLPDDGFSARVMAALPSAAPAPAPARVSQRRIFVLCAVGAAIGGVITFAGSIDPAAFTTPLAALGDAVTRLAGETVSTTGALVVIGTLGSLAIAYWRELRTLVNG